MVPTYTTWHRKKTWIRSITHAVARVVFLCDPELSKDPAHKSNSRQNTSLK